MATVRLRLTDQALVAARLAATIAQRRGSAATVHDLLVGLAAEPDGVAGRVLRERASAAAWLADRAAVAVPRLAPLDVALHRAVADAAPRPPGTADLLDAALAEGGAALAELLEAAGYEPEALRERPRSLAVSEVAGGETLGLDPTGPADAQLSGVAARVVAQVRAAGGGAVELLLALAAAPDADAATLLPGHAELSAALWRLRKRGQDAAGDPDWDRGLDHVVTQACAWRAGPQVTTVDLLRAALFAGGRGPSALLDGAAGLTAGR